MPRIRILPEHLSNKIAAGEVVERPASVVKELVENAIDAQSSTIVVEIENGGRSLIRVSDDGCGMDPDDALLCLERHATSKVSDEKSLFSIETLGFRGEAIPSIASVSEFVITTRARDFQTATQITVHGGTIKDVREAGAPPGTTVEVRRLFFNTPARRKFMRSVATEAAHIADTITSFALGRSDIHFKLIQDGRTVRNWPRTHLPAERAADVLGKEAAKNLVELSHGQGELSVSGWVSLPSVSRTTSRRIYLFVNGRAVKDRGLQYAVFEGYRGRLVKGAFPVAAVFVELPPDRVDVNVHPAKTEVRFADQRAVYRCVEAAVASALASAEAPPWEEDNTARPKTTYPQTRTSSYTVAAESVASYPRYKESQGLFDDPPARPVEPEHDPKKLAKGREDAVPGRISGLQVVGQVFNTYIVCQAENSLVLVDQHAAHERIVFEGLKRAADGQGPRQSLLVPETIDLTHAAAAALETVIDELASIGLEVEPFGKNAFVIKAVPPLLSSANVSAMVLEMAEKLAETGFAESLQAMKEEALHVMACHGSIRANQRLTIPEMEELVRSLAECDDPLHCPHGRPTFITWSTQEIERLFARIV